MVDLHCVSAVLCKHVVDLHCVSAVLCKHEVDLHCVSSKVQTAAVLDVHGSRTAMTKSTTRVAVPWTTDVIGMMTKVDINKSLT